MITVFKGADAETHNAFQKWRQEHPNGFHMTEGSPGVYTIHWTQDKRENAQGRGCWHQGVSSYRFSEDCCYTTTRKVCSDDLMELHDWAAEHSATLKNCGHCDTRKFPFPRV